MDVHLSAWQRPEAHSQSYTRVDKEQKDKCPWVAQSEPRLKLLSINAPHATWLSLNSFVQKNGQILPNQGVQSWLRPIPTLTAVTAVNGASTM